MKRFLHLVNAKKAVRFAGAVALLAATSTALGADHRDGESVKKAANIASDINDVYTFVSGGKVVLAMTVFPAAGDDAKFDPASVYVFHVDKRPGFGAPSAGTTNAICTFNAEAEISCWITDSSGTTDYVKGNADVPAGIQSENKKFKVFAGLRTDPFYFNLEGFNAARSAVFTNFGAIPGFNGNGCPIVSEGIGAALRTALVATSQDQDFFRSLNGLAIVIEAEPDLVSDATNNIISLYASTHATN